MTRSSETIASASPAFVARVRKALTDAESATDATLASQLSLMQTIVRTRQAEALPSPFVGQEALVRLGRALTKQIEASNEVMRAHAALRHDAVDVLMVAGEDDCPPPEDPKEPTGLLDEAVAREPGVAKAA